MSARQDYLLEVAARMWSGEPRIATPGTPGGRSFILVPSAGAPQLVLPAGAPRAAAAAVAGFTGHRTGLARWRSRALSLALATGAGERLLRGGLSVQTEGGIEAHLATLIGQPVLVSMQVGPPRANRKPVLQMLDRAGRILGYAKIGTNDLTSRLLDTEARALKELATAALPGIAVPELLHRGPWRDLDLLVQSPLPVRAARPPSPAQLEAAMVRLAATGTPFTVAAGESEFVRELVDDLRTLGPAGVALAADVETTVRAEPERPLLVGSRHGDWTEWNCATGPDGRLMLWDWERFDSASPQGFDALHHHLQRALHGQPPQPEHAAALIAAAPRLLAPFGVAAADAAPVAVLYLADIARRYLQDGQAGAGGRLGQVEAWLVPAVHSSIDPPTARRG